MRAARERYEADGVVRIAGVFSPDEVAAMRACVWARLAERGVTEDPATWRPGGALALAEVSGALRPGAALAPFLWEIGRDPGLAALQPRFLAAADRVFGRGACTGFEAGGLLMPNFPTPGTVWDVPHAAWHVDEPIAAYAPAGWGLLGFVCLDTIDAGGGATVAIAGSHRRMVALADALGLGADLLTTERAMAELAARDPWYDRLFRPGDPEARRAFLAEGHVSDGVPTRVVELVGEAGDLVLMDPRALHTLSPNVSARPRFVMRMIASRA